MNGINYSSDVASQLLNSSDQRVAAAARRVFSNAIIIEYNPTEHCKGTSSDNSNGIGSKNTNNDTMENHEIHRYMEKCGHLSSDDKIPLDIKEAASAVAMLAPRKCNFNVPKPIRIPAIVRSTNTFQVLDSAVSGGDLLTLSSSSSSSVSVDVKSVTPCPNLQAAVQDTTNLESPCHENLFSERKGAMSPDERLKRSRERNKMHARKTRQRKKEQMKTLEQQVDALKKKQIELKRLIEEKNTANILVDLYSKRDDERDSALDPKVEELLMRDTEDIPDSSKIPELPALILPGHHSVKQGSKMRTAVEYPDDGIDYELLAKDRTQCSQDELDMIRRERNRMHAKRTRDRKRIFIEKMEVILRQLENENKVLEDHLGSLLDSASSPTSHKDNMPDCEGAVVPTDAAEVTSIKKPAKVCETDIAAFLSREMRKVPSSRPTPVATDDMDCTASASSMSTDNCDVSTMAHSLPFPNEFERESKRRCVAS